MVYCSQSLSLDGMPSTSKKKSEKAVPFVPEGGILYVVSTPIGNLEDITLRALRLLKEVDWIASEDTRHTGHLLKHFQIEKPQISFHAHSGMFKVEKILEKLRAGQTVALVSDAGTPGISDPGYGLISRVVEEGINVIPIPGASALLAALVVSGLPMDKFVYLGFLPVKKGRETLFKGLKEEGRTIILYESPHRIHRTLSDLKKYGYGNYQISLARELTKLHETIYRGTVDEVEADFKGKVIKGEIVVVLHRV